MQTVINSILTGLLVAITGSLVRHTDYETTTVRPDEVVDFIVVGSGTAGSAVASRLSEHPSWSTLVLEAGGQPPPFNNIPYLFWYHNVGGDQYRFMYEIEPQKYSMKSYNEQSRRFLRGKQIGGTSALNAMVFARGNRNDFDRWAALGNPGWDYDSVLPLFKKLEDYKGKHAKQFAEYHGTGGPVPVESVGWSGPLLDHLVAAWEEIGLRETDFSYELPIGYTVPDLTVKKGQRTSSSDAYLKPHLYRPNLSIQINSKVIKVIIDKHRRAVGVKYIHEGKVQRAFARKEVILSAGAIDSPKLLLLSGVGPKEHLQSLGIETIVDVQGVGQNLQDHPRVLGLVWLTENDAHNTLDNDVILPLVSKRWRMEYRTNGTGPLSVPGSFVGYVSVNLGDNPDPKIPDAQIGFISQTLMADGGLFTIPSLGVKAEVADSYFKGQRGRSGFQCEPFATVPKSRGSVTLRSGNPLAPPVIDPNYLSHPDDIDSLVKSVKYCLAIGNTTAIREGLRAKFYDKPLLGCDHLPYGSHDYWRCFVQGLSHHGCHPAGTCKMAPDSDPNGVVSPRLKVHGISGLRVIDASIMPIITTNNLNAPTLMIGEKGAAMIKEDWGFSDL